MMRNEVGNDAEMRARALSLILEALKLVPLGEKEALIEALRTVPLLVETESDPIRFLRLNSFHAPTAARKLATYWRIRKELFGGRAFLPVTITGDGAMNEEDIAALMQGHHSLLPNDSLGRNGAVYFNMLSSVHLSDATRKRCIFYTFSLVGNERGEGATALGCVDTQWVNGTSGEALSILQALPITIQAIHIFCTTSNTETGTGFDFFSRFASMLLVHLGKDIFSRTQFHADLSGETLRTKLRTLGFREDCLPTALGGVLDSQQLQDNWIRDRMVEELRRNQPTSRPLVPSLNMRIPSVPFLSGRSDSMPLPASHQFLQAQLPGQLPVQKTAFPFLLGRAASMPVSTNQLLVQPQLAGQGPKQNVVAPFLLQQQQQPQLQQPEEDEYAKRGIRPVQSSIPLPETEAMRKTIREAVRESLELIPHDDKADYLEAIEKAPFLVETESDVLKFARAENYDPWAAARRLIAYWKVRKHHFGERAFLPMTQTGNGALTHEDIVVLKSGPVVILPSDDKGRHVHYSDRSRLIDKSPETLQARCRCLFYLLTIISESEITQKEGCVGMGLVLTPRMTDVLDRTHSNDMVEILHNAPCGVKAVHLLFRPRKAGQTLLDRMISSVMSIVGDRFGDKTLIHSGDTDAELLGKLKKFGLHKDGLPDAAGGSWKYEQFREWSKQRILQEQAFELQAGIRVEGEEATEFGGSTRPSLSRNEWKERRRQQNIIYSRQKRERRKAEISRVKEQCQELESANKRLKQDNERLEGLVSQAEAIVSMVRQGQLPAGGSSYATVIPATLQELQPPLHLPMNSLFAQSSQAIGGAAQDLQHFLARQVLLNSIGTAAPSPADQMDPGRPPHTSAPGTESSWGRSPSVFFSRRKL